MKAQTEKDAFPFYFGGKGWQFMAKTPSSFAKGFFTIWKAFDEICETDEEDAKAKAKREKRRAEGWRVSKEGLRRFEAEQARFEKHLAQMKERERQERARLFARNPALQFISNPQALKDAKEEDKRARNREACKRYRERQKAQSQTQTREKRKLQRATGGKGGKPSK